MNTMTTEQAIKTLIQAVEIAVTKGAFSLTDTRAINSAIDVFIKPVEEKVEKEESKKK